MSGVKHVQADLKSLQVAGMVPVGVAGRIRLAVRRLVGARAQPSIIRHHLLLALSEREETGHGLR